MAVTASELRALSPEHRWVWLETNLPIHTPLNLLLYPQYEQWLREIHEDDWRWLQREAHRLLGQEPERGVVAVRMHWQSVAAGVPPFGMRIRRNVT